MVDGVPEPEGLYDTTSLLGGWRADDPLSYLDTLDARTYVAAVRAGLRIADDEAVARARAGHDHTITWALGQARQNRRVVAFMGGHKLDRGSGPYALVAEIAWRLARDGFLVVSGGGPGAMEAAHLGARLAPSAHDELLRALVEVAADPGNRSFPDLGAAGLVTRDGDVVEPAVAALHAWQAPAFAVAERWSGALAGDSIGVPTWLYGHEPPTPLATRHAKYFENSIREDGLLAIAIWGVVYAEGKAGTLQEIFQDAAQNYYASVEDTQSRMVFLDLGEYWSVVRPVKLLLEGLFDDRLEELLHFVTTADAAVAAIAQGPRRRGE